MLGCRLQAFQPESPMKKRPDFRAADLFVKRQTVESRHSGRDIKPRPAIQAPVLCADVEAYLPGARLDCVTPVTVDFFFTGELEVIRLQKSRSPKFFNIDR